MGQQGQQDQMSIDAIVDGCDSISSQFTDAIAYLVTGFHDISGTMSVCTRVSSLDIMAPWAWAS